MRALPRAGARAVAAGVLAAGVPGARAAAQPRALGVGLTAEGETGVVSNPRFQSAADSADVLSRARVGVSLARRSARAVVTATADGELQRFQGAPDLSRSTYGASAAADARLTPRLDVRAGAAARTSLSRDVAAGSGFATGSAATDAPDAGGPAPGAPAAASGVLPLLPLSLSRTYTAQATAAYRTTELTTVTADAGLDRIRYDASALASGTSARARLSVVRQLASATAVSVTLEGHRTQTGGSVLSAESAALGWDARVFGAAQLRLRAGAGAYTTPGRAPTLAPAGSAELGASALGAAWTVRVVRDVTPLLGVGEVLATDQAEAAYSRVAPGGMLVRLGVLQAWSRVPTSPGPRTVTNASFADVRRPIAAGFWAGAGASRRSRTQDPTVRSQNIGVTAGYTGAW